MALTSAADLVAALRDHRLFDQAQLDQLGRELPSRPAEVMPLASDLVERGWLTPYQAHELLGGRGRELALGPYVLLDHLGGGPTGQVFLARHRNRYRLEAVKIIRKELLARPEALERFRLQVQAASLLDSPYVVRLVEAGQAGGIDFVATEYVYGADLGRVLKRHGSLPADRACAFIRQAALGVQHAHERGLVHLALKPADLLLTRSDAPPVRGVPPPPATGLSYDLVKVLDFGVTRLQDGPPGVATGPVIGTMDYLAPEQVEGPRRADARSDVYSLGCILYHALAGQVPFPGATFVEKVDKRLSHQLLPLERVRPEVPRVVAAVVRRMLALSPADRYATAADVALALERALASGPTPATGSTPDEEQTPAIKSQRAHPGPPRPDAPPRRLPFGCGGVLLLALLAGAGGLAGWLSVRAATNPPAAIGSPFEIRVMRTGTDLPALDDDER